MSMLANFLKRDTDGHLRLLVMILLAVSLSVSQSFADVGDEEEYYDEFEDTTFEFADEEYDVELDRAEDLRERRRGRIISRSYMFEGPYLGFQLQHSGGVLRDNSSRRQQVTGLTTGNNPVPANTAQAAGDSNLNAFSDNTGFGMLLGFGDVFERHGIYVGGEFGASITKKQYDYLDDITLYEDLTTRATRTVTNSNGQLVPSGPTSPNPSTTTTYSTVLQPDVRTRTVEMDYDLDFSARVGYLVQPYHLFYTQLGYSIGFYTMSSRGPSPQGYGPPAAGGSSIELRDYPHPEPLSRGVAHGWHFGFGSEIAVGDRSAFRFGWLVRDYGDSLDELDTRHSLNSRGSVLSAGTGDSRQYSPRTYSLQVGFTFYPGSEGEHKNMKVRGGTVGDGVYGGALFHHSNSAYNKSRLANFTTVDPRIIPNTTTTDTGSGRTTTTLTQTTVTRASRYENDGNDYGQDFFGWAGFLGYGFDMGRVFAKSALDGIYLGSEIEFGSPVQSEVARNIHMYPGRDGTGGAQRCNVDDEVFKRRSDVALLGRLGYRFTPQTLVYLKGGYGWAQFESRHTFSTFSSSSTSVSPCDNLADATYLSISPSPSTEKHTLESYRIGLGVESVLYDNVFMRMDWTYLSHEDHSVQVRKRGGGQDGRSTNYGGFDDNRISLGVGYTFEGIGPL